MKVRGDERVSVLKEKSPSRGRAIRSFFYFSMIARRILSSSRSVEQLLFAAMAPQRRSTRLQATTTPSSSNALSAVKKEASAGKKKKTATKASASASAPSTSTSRKAAAAKEEQEQAPASAASKRAPPTKTAAEKTKAKKAPSSSSSSAGGGGPTRDLEQQLWRHGFSLVAGVDEAGRGPLAGPVVAAAAVLPRDVSTGLPSHIRLDDSKKMTEEQREQAFEALESAAGDYGSTGVAFAVCVVSPKVVDEVNILEATMQAMDRAVQELSEKLYGSGIGAAEGSEAAKRGGQGQEGEKGGAPLAVLVDGNRLPPRLAALTGSSLPSSSCSLTFHARAVVKGDAKSTAIAAASIVAKVTRDRLMREASEKWPRYGFENHKGYGTAAHVAVIRKYGPCEIHRRSFEPIKSIVGWSRGEIGNEG